MSYWISFKRLDVYELKTKKKNTIFYRIKLIGTELLNIISHHSILTFLIPTYIRQFIISLFKIMFNCDLFYQTFYKKRYRISLVSKKNTIFILIKLVKLLWIVT